MIPQTTPSGSKPNKPKLPNNAKLGSFIVRAKPGFSILGIHKFKVFNREGFAVPEYCKPCSTARRVMGVDGSQADYVKSALNKYASKPTGQEPLASIKREFSALLANEYQQFRR